MNPTLPSPLTCYSPLTPLVLKFGFRRETTPFVFTPAYAAVLGGEGSAKFEEFVELCCKCYNVIRRSGDLLLDLFQMMLSTGIPVHIYTHIYRILIHRYGFLKSSLPFTKLFSIPYR